jgi:hypothetical protein
MSRILVLSLVLLVGCGRDGTEIAAVPGDVQSTVTLRLGETRPVRGTALLLTFRRVLEDSRCPVDVVCITAGDAAVELLVRTTVSTSEPVKLYLDRQPREMSRQGYKLTLQGLQPARRTDRPIPQAEYGATLSVVAP